MTMKKILFVFIIMAVSISTYSQDFDCGNTTATISNLTCNDNGTPDPSDDFFTLTFDVTATSGTSHSARIFQLPAGSTAVGPQGNQGPNTDFIASVYNDPCCTPSINTPLDITIPSAACADINYLIDIYGYDSGTMTSNDCAENMGNGFSGTLMGPPPIPTMGQWGLIILGILLASIGIIWIRNRSIAAA
jgi:hypothetical protein